MWQCFDWISTGMIWIYPCVLKPTVLVYNYIVEEEEKSIFYPMIHGYQSFHVIFTYVTDLLFLLSLHMIPYHVYRVDSQLCENPKSNLWPTILKKMQFLPKSASLNTKYKWTKSESFKSKVVTIWFPLWSMAGSVCSHSRCSVEVKLTTTLYFDWQSCLVRSREETKQPQL